MKVKTYGVPGLSEWHGTLKVGSIETNVTFVGGTASPSGSQPAYMTTKDPIVQFVIENSKEFKDGFIILLLTQEVEGVHPRMAVAKAAPASQPKVSQPKSAVSGGAAAPVAPVAPAAVEPVAPASESQPSTAVSGEGEEGGEGASAADSNGGVETVEVACKADAVEWLKERYPEKGYNGNNLRSKDAFAAACKEHGVEFIIANA